MLFVCSINTHNSQHIITQNKSSVYATVRSPLALLVVMKTGHRQLSKCLPVNVCPWKGEHREKHASCPSSCTNLFANPPLFNNSMVLDEINTANQSKQIRREGRKTKKKTTKKKRIQRNKTHKHTVTTMVTSYANDPHGRHASPS